MSEEYKTSPYRRQKNDLEAGTSDFYDEDDSGPFDILRTKSASVDRLRRWRVSVSYIYIICTCTRVNVYIVLLLFTHTHIYIQ